MQTSTSTRLLTRIIAYGTVITTEQDDQHPWWIKSDGLYKVGETIEEIAASENLSKKSIFHLIDLAFLAPDIVKSVLQGEQPTGLTTEYLRRFNVPSNWSTQREIFSTL